MAFFERGRARGRASSWFSFGTREQPGGRVCGWEMIPRRTARMRMWRAHDTRMYAANRLVAITCRRTVLKVGGKESLE